METNLMRARREQIRTRTEAKTKAQAKEGKDQRKRTAAAGQRYICREMESAETLEVE